MSLRIEKINRLIKKEVGNAILSEVNVPTDIMVTVLDANTSKDLRYVDVFISVFPATKKEELQDILKKDIYFIQKYINNKLVIKIFPKIRFIIDNSGEYVSKIDELIKETHKE